MAYLVNLISMLSIYGGFLEFRRLKKSPAQAPGQGEESMNGHLSTGVAANPDQDLELGQPIQQLV
jgi:hypothetical protein